MNTQCYGKEKQSIPHLCGLLKQHSIGPQSPRFISTTLRRRTPTCAASHSSVAAVCGRRWAETPRLYGSLPFRELHDPLIAVTVSLLWGYFSQLCFVKSHQSVSKTALSLAYGSVSSSSLRFHDSWHPWRCITAIFWSSTDRPQCPGCQIFPSVFSRGSQHLLVHFLHIPITLCFSMRFLYFST